MTSQSQPVLVSNDQPAAELSAANGPELWDAILARFPPGTIVAGGAVRDFLLGVAPKDVDVFLNVNRWPACRLPGFESLGANKDAEYAAMPTIAVVQRGTICGVQVDAVGVWIEAADPPDALDPAALVSTFDFGVARCWYDGERIHDTPEAAADRNGRSVTRLLHDRPERGEARFARFNERMGGGWKYVIQPEPEPAIADTTDRSRPGPGGHLNAPPPPSLRPAGEHQ